ncbi:MAG: hypothetical protein CYG59_21035 [Chloroflexi bacterium]|nr:MAG: hypothetical protein CYG59_21035 [Chloroflexota bacterium]
MESTNGKPTAVTERQPWELYMLLGGLVVFTTLVVMNNVPPITPLLLTLITVGVGLALLLPLSAGALASLAIVVAWVLLRQTTGIWSAAEIPESIIEMCGIALLLGLAIRYRFVWHRQQQELTQLRELQKVLVAGERGTGILSFDVAMLRLDEELDRASSFGRPLALLLVDIEPRPEATNEDLQAVDQAITRKLSRAASVHDIPFRASNTRVGLILPERDWQRLYEHAESVTTAITTGRYLDRSGKGQHIHDKVNLTFGLGTYQGETATSVDLMQAAQDSLNVSRDLADLDGNLAMPTFAMPATPIGETAVGSANNGDGR